MSKSKGNAVDPFEALETLRSRCDPLVFLCEQRAVAAQPLPWESGDGIFPQVMGTLWNTYAFFVLYANIDEFDPTKYELDYEKLSVMDKWLLSRLYSTIQEADNDLAN